VSDGGWSFGGSILTFAFPMLLFIVVAVALYVLYTKPTVVPGHRTSPVERSVSHTAIPGIPGATEADAGVVGGGNEADAGVVGGGNEIPGNLARAPGIPAADDAAMAADGENAAPEVQE
jgi:hypothetical protein